MDLTFCDNTTGAIVAVVSTSVENIPSYRADFPNATAVPGKYSEDIFYFDNRSMQIVPRQPLSAITSWNKTTILANGTDTGTITGLPNPSVLQVTPAVSTGIPQQTPETITSGTWSINTDSPGGYSINIKSFPFRDYTQIITAT